MEVMAELHVPLLGDETDGPIPNINKTEGTTTKSSSLGNELHMIDTVTRLPQEMLQWIQNMTPMF